MSKPTIHNELYCRSKHWEESGFSLLEIFIVVAIVVVLAAISLPNLYNTRRLYQSEDQSFMIMDALRETSQLAMMRRRTFRLEIDLTDNAILIIDENNAAPDTLVKRLPLLSTNDIRVDIPPDGVSRPNPPDYYDIYFAPDSLGHYRNGQQVIGNTVWAARFRRDGSVVTPGGSPLSSTIFIWPPQSQGSDQARALSEVRAITMFGGSGAVRYWKYNGAEFLEH